MKLFHRWFGEEQTGTPLVILHGLLGASDNWQTLGRRFAQSRPVLLVDQRNHGRSPHHPSHTYSDLAIDLLNLLDELDLVRVDLLGHSMGGKVVMKFSVEHRARVRKVIVADIAPVAYTPHHMALFDALAGLDLETVKRRGEIDEQLAEKISNPGVRMFLLKGLYRKDPGGFAFRYNLPVLRTHLEELSGNPRCVSAEISAGNPVDDLCIEAPTLAIYGGNSNYVEAEGEAALKAKCADLSTHCLPDTGHWLHAEDPDGFFNVVSAFLRGSAF